MKGYFLHEGYAPVGFVGSYQGAVLSDEVKSRIVDDLHTLLKLDADWAASCKTVADALRTLKDSVEAVGVSVVINGVVSDNTHRVLDVEEVRGFVLADKIAPVIFMNGRDTKSAQIFTLVHELCRLAFFQTGVSNAADDEDSDVAMERFCNAVAADFLVPMSVLASRLDDGGAGAYPAIKAVAHACKVNFIVVARRAKDARLIDEETFFAACQRYKDDVSTVVKAKKGGAITSTINAISSEPCSLRPCLQRFIPTTSYRDAYDLTGLSAPSFKVYFEEVA